MSKTTCHGWDDETCWVEVEDGKLWCPKHDAMRIKHLNVQFKKMLDEWDD